MNSIDLNTELQGMDLSLFDQLLKGRFIPGSNVLDAGFGGGRNSYWFINNGFDVFGVDQKEEAATSMQQKLAQQQINGDQFIVGDLNNLPYATNAFDIIICNAVLHFATSNEHFHQMFAELVRVLSATGILFIRMTSNIGIADKLDLGNKGVFLLPDGSHRFLLTQKILRGLLQTHQLQFVDPLKTVNVNDIRCMSTLILTKTGIEL